MVPTFFPKILATVKKGVDWLKVRSDKPEININSPRQNIKIGRLDGGTLIINIFRGAKDYDPSAEKEIFTSMSHDIQNHEAIGLLFDPSLSIATSQKLTPIQRNKIELFKKAGWKPDKLASIKIAFKIINLEDSAQYEEAGNLMASAFNGRKKSMNKKFYNLARAGYLDGFAMQLMLSNELHSDDAITKILDYFPEAIFIDEGTDALKFIQDLQRREHENVRTVAVYARGDKHIANLNYFYDQYMTLALKKIDEGVILYILTSSEEYKIASNKAVRIELDLRHIKIQNY
jgi:hypothetical protein